MCEPRAIEVGEKVRETVAYRKCARDREVRGEIASFRGAVATVRNADGWEMSLHRDWLERDYDATPSGLTIGLFKTTWSKKKPSIFEATRQNFCQNCGAKL